MRTNSERDKHFQEGIAYILEFSPHKADFYDWYRKHVGVGYRQAHKDYSSMLSIMTQELTEVVENKRTNRILRLESILYHWHHNVDKAEIDPEVWVKTILSIEKQIAMLEGLNQISTKVEHSGIIEAPLFGITTTEDNEIHKDEDGQQDTAAPE